MPKQLFATAGSAYIGAMVCSIEALKYVSFPTRELGKACKVNISPRSAAAAVTMDFSAWTTLS